MPTWRLSAERDKCRVRGGGYNSWQLTAKTADRRLRRRPNKHRQQTFSHRIHEYIGFQLSLDRSQYSRVYIIIDSGSYPCKSSHKIYLNSRSPFKCKKHFSSAWLIDNQTIPILGAMFRLGISNDEGLFWLVFYLCNLLSGSEVLPLR
jgi:hypothetical protein